MIAFKVFLLISLLTILEGAGVPRITPVMHKHPHGHSINVLKFNDDETLRVDYEAFNELFMHSDVKDRNIAAVSIIGAFRKGKSFFMDYCLRFMYANYKSVSFMSNPLNNKAGWMGKPEDPLTGFSWKAGSARDTTGIIIWSDVFLHEKDTGEKIAIVLMDTQGLFDSKTSPADNSRIFALGTLISSVQIVNIMQVIQEDQLQYLQLATDFAKFAHAESDSSAKPFQNLMFLIRDWVHADKEIGLEGGKEYITEVLKIDDKQHSEIRSVREYLAESFESISCFLMPQPPSTIQRGIMKNKQPYDGRTSEMGDEFKFALKDAVESVLAVENLQLKRINGDKITSAKFKELVDQYFQLFTSKDAPKAESIYEITVKKQMNDLTDELVTAYSAGMYKSIDIKNPNLEAAFPNIHSGWRNTTIFNYMNTKKMGTKSHEKLFAKLLLEKIDEKMKEVKKNSFIDFDQFQKEQAQASVVSEGLDNRHKVMLKELVDLEFQIKNLDRNKDTMDEKTYDSKRNSLYLNKQSVQSRIDNHVNRLDMQEYIKKMMDTITLSMESMKNQAVKQQATDLANRQQMAQMMDIFAKIAARPPPAPVVQPQQTCIVWGLACW